MSVSKFVMAQKLHNVQKSLMSESLKGISVEMLLSKCFQACSEEGLCFWFNFLEDSAVLNLRDVEHENFELNIRLHYSQCKNDDVKLLLLCNAFLIVKEAVKVSQKDKSEGIINTDIPVPPHIRETIKVLEDKGVPVTAESIRNHLPLKNMGNNARMKCNNYLKQMEES